MLKDRLKHVYKHTHIESVKRFIKMSVKSFWNLQD